MADRKEPPFYNDDNVGSFHYKLPFYDTMELFIETLTGTCFELRVSPFETVISVKAKIQRLEGIPVAQQHLIWNSLELEDEYCLHDYSIAEGCTLKLVLAMRGGPINTRRVAMEDPGKEMSDLMDGCREEGWEKSLPNKQVTFLVYREGDQLNFFRVVDRGDGTLTPVSESLSGGSVCNVYGEEEDDGEGSLAGQQTLENSITMNKMKLLKAKMEDMNLNKKPKKSAKLKPRPPVGPRPCSNSIPLSTRNHRLFHVLPQINHSYHSNMQLPPIRDHGSISPSRLGTAVPSAHLSITRRAPPTFTSSSCYMLQEEEPWDSGAAFAKIRPPPKVSRLDIGGTRLMRDCVYPQLPALSTRGQADGAMEGNDAIGNALGVGLAEDVVGLKDPLVSGDLYGDLLSDPLSLDVSTPERGQGSLEGLGPLDVGVQHQLASTPTLLSQAVGSGSLGTLELGPADGLASRGERTQLGNAFHISPAAPPLSTTSPVLATRQLPQPFEFTTSTLLCPSPPTRSSTWLKPDGTTPLPTSPSRTSHLHGIKVDSLSKCPEMISKSDARDITLMANQASKEPVGSLRKSDLLALASRTADKGRESLSQSLGLGLGLPAVGASGLGRLGSMVPSNIHLLQDDLIRRMSPLHRAAASYMSPATLGSAGGASCSIRKLGTPSYHLPPVKAPLCGKKKNFKHCFLCGKKTGLANSYECRCGNNFCATHRYAETHDCTYDYKSTGRRFLQETNPIISAPKLPKI
ncbi:AN1-type zinc finger protein 4 [Osmerus eperlanus]|uniref:AN1-type zinc finger protein 4 n=1 Tax=Osmerus eperlanus TaxID=29151 RepID=UPI002E0D198B